MANDYSQKLQHVLQTQFNFTSFRPGQLEALTVLLQEGRLLCIQPTGHGKSLLYQLPATMLDGLTLVISPLLALMRDQITQLKQRFNISATSFNTDQSDEENIRARKDILENKIKILFISPEQLDHIERFNFLMNLPIKLLVVDEAHCISTWGHDFRPSYRQIIHLVQALTQKRKDIRVLALTATANKKTEEDIKKQLTINQLPLPVHRESMNRANIRLTVIPVSGTNVKLATLIDLLRTLPGSGLIYCATRENTELVAEFLNTQGIHAAAYHAGFTTQEKKEIQEDFISDKYPVIAATNALGMGIDKSNLRFIIHFDFPGSVTAYYQEVGRAGRDGLPAEGILLYDNADSKIQRHFIDSAQPTPADFQEVLKIIQQTQSPVTLAVLKRLSGMHPTKLNVVIAELVEQAFVKKISVGGHQTYQLAQKPGIPNLQRYDTQHRVRNLELANMQWYAENPKKCLMAQLREALGDIHPENCGKCNRCVKESFSSSEDLDLITAITHWLDTRTIPIVLAKSIKNTATGIAVVDGKLRSSSFVHFMRERSLSKDMTASIPESLLQLIKTNIYNLASRHQFSCIIPIPSRTWAAQLQFVAHISHYLNIPVFSNLLSWNIVPDARQGELLNNDQRKHNVSKRMQVETSCSIPNGSVLLLDDYLGSGATLNEAARALREHGLIENKIVPFTIAAIKWKLGKKGMI